MAVGAAVAAFAFVSLKLRMLALDPGRFFPDTLEYVKVAHLPISQADFWGALRPPGLPLFYKMLGVSLNNYDLPEIIRRVGMAQTIVSCLGWLALAAAVAGLLRLRWLKLAAFVSVLAFGLNIHVAQWDALLISESLATSLYAAWLATFLLVTQMWRPETRHWRLASAGLLAAFGLLTLLLALVRDLNAYLLLGLAGLILAGLALTPVRVKAGGLAAFVLAVFVLAGALSIASSNRGQRWKIPLLGVMHERIFTTKQATDFFESRGMPTGKWERVPVTREGRAFFLAMVQYDPEAAAFEEWIERRGRAVYAQYLLTHPKVLIGGPAHHVRSLLSPNSTEYRTQEAETPVWLASMSRLLYPLGVWVPIALASGTLLALPWIVSDDEGPLWLVPVFALLLISPFLMVFVWHADSIEVERHAYPIAMQVRLAVWVVVFAAIDKVLLAKFRSRERDHDALRGQG